MGYFSSTYLIDIRPVLLDWLTNSGSSKNVTDLPLSLANRAQKNLWAKKPWVGLVKTTSLALTNGRAFLPNDFGRIVDVHADMDGNGVGDYWLYEGDSYDRGYKIEPYFTKESGPINRIAFNYAQPVAPRMRYQKMLEDFTGTGTEYSFFPSELVIIEAQRINTLGKGNIKEYQAFNAAFIECYQDYCNSAQWVNHDNEPRINDRFGYEISSESFSLGGNTQGPYSELPNGYIL
jgi:hypothetical protein